ncbi:MAG: PD40 domain-containing protein [Acidobacteria bacterium]|nr:PD40 domain-containing protein [Acidobacteriota bacterium]
MPLRSPLACVFFFTFTASAQFTVEQVLSSSFPWEIASAARANRVAWVVSGNGDWNVWLAEGPAYQGRQATSFKTEDGQEISELAWSADGERLLFVRGGSAGRGGESPNPSSNVKGADQSVWLVEWKGGQPRRLGEGRAPLLSADGKRALWLRGGNIWSADLSTDARPAILFRARGSASDLALSPDGAFLAFTSTRSDHSFIGVYSFAAQSITWLDPSTDKDLLPTWSPDGKSVAFLRILSERPAAPPRRPPHRLALEPPRGRRRHRRSPGGVSRRRRPGQRLPASRRGPLPILVPLRLPGVSLGKDELETPLRRPRFRWTRAPAHPRRVRGGVRRARPGSPVAHRLLQPGRHRS